MPTMPTMPPTQTDTAAADRRRRHAFGAVSNAGGAMLPNGTVWTHAAALGRFLYRGEWEDINGEKVTRWVRNFAHGWPRKVPFDWEHDSADAETPGPRPKSGTVCELKAVLSDDDITPEIRAVVDAHRAWAQSTGAKDDAEPWGLWARWEPVARAVSMLKAREYTEASVEFADVTNPETGEEQGSTILAIALTNRPFLNRMIRVAASRDGAALPSASGNPEVSMKLLTSLAALLGKPVATEDEAADETRRTFAAKDAEITTLSQRVRALEPHEQTVTTLARELGTDAAGLPAKVREMSAAKAASDAAAERARRDARDAQVRTFSQTYEPKFKSVPARERWVARFTADLDRGQEPGKTDAEADLADEAPSGHGSQVSAADGGENAPTDPEEKVAKKAGELMESDADLKKLSATDFPKAYGLALSRAAKLTDYKPAPRPAAITE